MKTMNTVGTRVGMALLGIALLAGGVGCGASATVSPRLSVLQEHAAVQIDGEGKVEGGGIACGPNGVGRCEGNFEDLWATQLVAQPADGWRFAGWQRSAKQALAPSASADATVTYTARFERDSASVARASKAASSISE